MPSASIMIVGYAKAEQFADHKVLDNRDYKDIAMRWEAKADRYQQQGLLLDALVEQDLAQELGHLNDQLEAA